MRALYRAGRASEALDSFQDLRRGLADELGLDPAPELAALHRAILAGDPAEEAPVPAARPVRPGTNLPAPVAELIGREHDVERVRELLSAGRLVTLTGPGGVGKTTVAGAVARSVADAHPDGVWLVDLTTWDGRGDPAEPVLAALSIADARGSEPAGERLASALRGRRMLLMLDNCEHVVEPVAGLVAALLAAAPDLRVLATSREPLRLRGEARVDLPPLEVPDTDDPVRLARSAAVRLFLARAGLARAERAQSEIAPDPETIAAVAEVCRRLDGIPLALELAATRAAALGVPELASRLRVPQDRFGLLATGPRDAPARQRTLAAVIDWSWQLLTDPERAVLRRLAVHAGGCTLDAAEAVCAGAGIPTGDVLDLLAGLVDRSLVVRGAGPGTGSRFRLLDSVAAYCVERLREAGEDAAVRRRHAEHYLGLAERAEPELRGPDLKRWLIRLDAEAANLRGAMDTFRRERASEPALRLALAMAWHRYLRGRLTEARRALGEALAVPTEGVTGVTGGAAALRAKAAAWEAGLAIRQGLAGPERIAEVLAGADALDPVERARAEWFLAAASIDFGDTKATGDLLERALEAFRAAGDRWGEAAALSTRAMLGHMRDDLGGLEADARRSAELFGALGDDWGVLQATDWLIGLADLTADHDEAARLARDGLGIAEDLGLWSDVSGRLGWLAWIGVQVGDYPVAAERAEQARRLAAEQGQRSGEVFAVISLAFANRRAGRLDVAEEHLRWLLESARKQQTGDGSPPYLSMVLIEWSLLDAQRGDAGAALARLREAYAVATEENWSRGTAGALAAMAAALTADGRPEPAARLLGAAESVRSEHDRPLSASDRTDLARITASVRAAAPAFDALFARGRELTPEQALSLLDRDGA
jgi:predicted ATPase